MKKKFVRSSSGHELNLQVNYLVTALLTLFLLPTMKITAKLTGQPSRLTIMTSEMHMSTSFKQRSAPSLFDLLDDEHSFTPEAYNVSKLLVVFWVRDLASKTDPSDVIVNCVNQAYVGAPCTEMTTTWAFACLSIYVLGLLLRLDTVWLMLLLSNMPNLTVDILASRI